MRALADPLAITGAAARSAAGELGQTCAAIRANLVRFAEHAFYEALLPEEDPESEFTEPSPLVAAPVPEIDPLLGGGDRLLALLVPVVKSLLQTTKLRRTDIEGSALLVALPFEDEAVRGWPSGEALLDEFSAATSLVFKVARTAHVGHTGVLQLLAEAGSLLAEGKVTRCVVAAADSYLSEDRLLALDRAYRVKSRRNVDGFVPGEGAAAFLVEAGTSGRARTLVSGNRTPPLPPIAVVRAVGLGQEPQTSFGDKPSSGAGLTEAFRAVLGPEPPRWGLCDLNGESYRGFEWAVVRSRLGEALAPLGPPIHAASALGDTGAASAGLALCTAISGFSRGFAPDRSALVWASSDGPGRAALRVSAP